jgi:hypothetical protein
MKYRGAFYFVVPDTYSIARFVVESIDGDVWSRGSNQLEIRGGLTRLISQSLGLLVPQEG